MGTNDKTKICKDILTKVNDIITTVYNKHVFGHNDLSSEEIDAVINFSDDITYEIGNLLKEIECEVE